MTSAVGSFSVKIYNTMDRFDLVAEKPPMSDEPLTIDNSIDGVRECYDNALRIHRFFESKNMSACPSNRLEIVINCGGAVKNSHGIDPEAVRILIGSSDAKHFAPFHKNFDILALAYAALAMYQINPVFAATGRDTPLGRSIQSVFAICCRQSYDRQDRNEDWVLAVGLLKGGKGSTGTGNFVEPKNSYKEHPVLGDGTQASHMDDWSSMPGSSEYNAGVGNKAFHSMCKVIGGCSHEKPLNIWKLALVKSKPCDGFEVFGHHTEVVARQFGTEVVGKVKAAWKERNVDIRERSYLWDEKFYDVRNGLAFVGTVIGMAMLSKTTKR